MAQRDDSNRMRQNYAVGNDGLPESIALKHSAADESDVLFTPQQREVNYDDDYWPQNSTDSHYFSSSSNGNTFTVDFVMRRINENITNNVYANVDFESAHPNNLLTITSSTNTAQQLIDSMADEKPAVANYSCEGWLWKQGSGGNISILTIGIVTDAVIVLLNCIVLLSFAMQPAIRRPSNLYILNLALCDLMTGINTIPYRFIMDVSGCWPYSLTLCRVSTTLSWITINEAALTIVLIAYDRLLKVRLGAAFAQKETVIVVVTRLALSWIGNIVIWTALNWVHVFTGLSLSERSACHTEFFQLPIEAVIVILMLSYFVPPLLCCLVYVWVWKLMYERRKKLDSKRNIQPVSAAAATNSIGNSVKSLTPNRPKDAEAAFRGGERIQLLQKHNGHNHYHHNNATSPITIVADDASMASVGTCDSGSKVATRAKDLTTITDDNTGAVVAVKQQRNNNTNIIISSDGSSRRRLAGGHLDRMTRMLILISCIFMILWLPNGILAVTIGFVGREMQRKGRNQSLYELYTNLVRVTMIAQYCLYFNSAINPALYAFGFPAIREAMIKSVLPRAMWIKLFAAPQQHNLQQRHQTETTTANTSANSGVSSKPAHV